MSIFSYFNKVGLFIFPFWTSHFVVWTRHFGWTPRLNYTVVLQNNIHKPVTFPVCLPYAHKPYVTKPTRLLLCPRPRGISDDAVWRLSHTSGRRAARPAWLKDATARYCCRPGRGHIAAAVRLQLVSCFYAALLPRRGPHNASHSVCLSVRPVIVTERHVAPPSELQWHTCTFRHAQRAAYRTAISGAQILVTAMSDCVQDCVLIVWTVCDIVSV